MKVCQKQSQTQFNQNGLKMDLKWTQNRLKMNSNRLNLTKMDLKWTQNGLKVDLIRTQMRLKIDSNRLKIYSI